MKKVDPVPERGTVSDSEGRRVLYVIDGLQNTAGGAEGVLRKLCQLLPAHRVQCSVVTFGIGDGVAQQFPCPVHVVPLSRTHHWSALLRAVDLARLLRKEKVDIVHTFFPASDIWGGLVAWLSGCRILVSSRRDMGILRSSRHYLPYLIANRLFTQVQAVSESVRKFCIEVDHLSAEKVVTVPNGVDLESIDACVPANPRSVFDTEGDQSIVTTVANVRYVKGIDILIRAAALVVPDFPAVRFVIIGESHEAEYQQELQDLAARLGVSRNVIFLGRRNDVCALLKASDVFCLPSRSEGMSNALLEAMACSLPCVATNVGGNPEVLIAGHTGFLAPPEDPQALASHIDALLRDRTLRIRMGQAGRQLVQNRFTIQGMVERVSDLYTELIQRRGAFSHITRMMQTDRKRGRAIARSPVD